MSKKSKIKVTKDGPYLVEGSLPMNKEIIVSDYTGVPVEWKKGAKYPDQEKYTLCRCGQSKNMPYCDGSHRKSGFKGDETASRDKYIDRAERIKGPGMDLIDLPILCVGAHFCLRNGGTWKLTDESDNKHKKAMAIQEAGDCPSGRLVAWEKNAKKPIEPRFKPSISLMEDPGVGVSGPIWVKGGVPIESADGTQYEVRNRVTLCRCGKSKNKPFCDGAHIRTGFNDGDKLLNQ